VSGQRLFTFAEPSYQDADVAFSPDGKRLAISLADSTVKILEATTPEVTNFVVGVTLVGHKIPVHSIQFSADGKRLLTAGDDGTARLWDTQSGRELLNLGGRDHKIYSAALFPDDQRILSANQGSRITASVWTAATDQEVKNSQESERALQTFEAE
jgi:WD40 repeat protein